MIHIHFYEYMTEVFIVPESLNAENQYFDDVHLKNKVGFYVAPHLVLHKS